MHTLRHAASLLATLSLLSACGGGGEISTGSSTPNTSVPLSTSADVKREISNLGTVSALTSSSALGSSAASAAVAQSSSSLRPASVDALQPQLVSNCAGGGSVNASSGSGSHVFGYFGTTQTVSYKIADFSSCVQTQTNNDGSTTTVTLNKHGEAGNTSIASDNSQYAYTLFGSGSTALSVRTVDKTSAGSVTLDSSDQLLGTLEAYSKDLLTDARTVLHDDHSESRSTGTYTATIDAGSGSTPFKLTKAGTTNTTFDGPYAYKTSLCSGGSLSVATPSTLTLDSNSYPIGGSLKFTSGSATATATFNSDGSATIQFSTGGSGTLSSSEVHNAIDVSQC